MHNIGTRYHTPSRNLEYMRKEFSFFIPDEKYVTDKKQLLEYLGGKVYHDKQCISCNRVFETLQDLRRHSVDKWHTHLKMDKSWTDEELEPFYDFTKSYLELSHHKRLVALRAADDDDGWEDEDDLDDPGTEEFGAVLARYGLQPAALTATGSLVLPTGREVPSRAVAHIYRQRMTLPPVPKKKRVALAICAKGQTTHATLRKWQKLEHRSRAKHSQKLGCKSNKLIVSGPRREDFLC
eukprot:Polyplicarium_translucidae@DN1595_c0_g1_i2.p1